MGRDAGGLRRERPRAGASLHCSTVNAQHAKQLFKNSLYRSLGETSSALGLDRREPRTLRVLMYHKINDIPDNPTTVPIGLFDEQMSQLADLGFTVVGLDAV